MKLIVLLCAILACCSAKPAGFAYSSYSPYVPAPYYYPYGYSEPAVIPYSGPAVSPYPFFAYNSIPAPVVKYVAPVPAATVKYVAPSPVPVPAPAPVIVPAASAPVVAVAPAPIPVPAAGVKSQYHSQDIVGNAKYGHDEPGQSHHAIQDAAGNKYGTFSYIKPDGSVSITQYSADSEGYRVASNDLPVGPAPAPVVPIVPIVPVEGPAPIPVVAADPVPAPAPANPSESAPESNEENSEQSESSSDSNGDSVEVASNLAKRSINVQKRSKRSVVLPNGYLADTPEVAAAKAAHFAEHAKLGSYYYTSAPLSYSSYNSYPYAYSSYQYSVLPYSAYPYSYAGYPYSYVVPVAK